MFNFLDKVKVKANDLATQTNQFLVSTYRQSLDILSPSSAFGQVLIVVQEYVKLILFYIEDSITELNIYKANKVDSVYGLARLTGHNPTRAISAQGSIDMQIKPGASSEIDSNFFFIPNYLPLKNKFTGIEYILLLESDRIRVDKNTNTKINIKSVQGKIESRRLVSDGTALQSFNVNIRNSGEIENDHIWIYVNSEKYDLVESLYDMNKDQKACIVKTGINGGIDIYFGNEDFGTIPTNGATIEVKYLISAGAVGIINSVGNSVDWEVLEDVSGILGDQINLNDIMNISIGSKFLLGSDGEDVNLTRIIAGSNSKSLVLAHPRNYVHYLSRFDQFSFIDAYTTFDDEYLDDDNIIYLFLIPNVAKKIDASSDYFVTDINNFYLDTDEKNRLKRTIQKSGRQIVTTELKINDPIVTNYILNIYLRIFDTADESILKADITSRLGEYFLNVKRRDKIPKSDIIEILEGINGIDSVNVRFVSKQNEEAIKNGYYYKTTFKVNALTSITEPIREQIQIAPGQDPMLGLDEFGDIHIGNNELPIIRGGWSDRNDVYFESGSADTEFSSLNILIKDTITDDITAQIARQKKQNVKNSF